MLSPKNLSAVTNLPAQYGTMRADVYRSKNFVCADT